VEFSISHISTEGKRSYLVVNHSSYLPNANLNNEQTLVTICLLRAACKAVRRSKLNGWQHLVIWLLLIVLNYGRDLLFRVSR
jgi:hypothetical protein